MYLCGTQSYISEKWKTGLTDWTRSSDRMSRTSSLHETSSSAWLVWSSTFSLFNGLSNLSDLLRGSLLSNLLGDELVDPSSGLKQDLLGGGWRAGVEDIKQTGDKASFAGVDSTQVLTGEPFLRELVSFIGVGEGQLKVFFWMWILASNEVGLSTMLSGEALWDTSSAVFREKRLWKDCERWDSSVRWNSKPSSTGLWGGNEDEMEEGVSLEYPLCSVWMNGIGSGSSGISSPLFKKKNYW